jgi:hypothetical protein
MTDFEKLSLVLAIVGVAISALAVIKSVTTAQKIHKEQMLLSRRQLFLEIWPRLEGLDNIDPANPVGVNVVKTVNVLELVGLCWEGEMVDADVIRRSFGESFLRMYDQVHAVTKLPIGKSGPDLISENPAIGKLYEILKKEKHDRGAISPVAKE